VTNTACREGVLFRVWNLEGLKNLKGDASADLQPWPETEKGLLELGLEFKHANPGNARGQPIERVIGAVQNLMEAEPGYVGRNEMCEHLERTKRMKWTWKAGERIPPNIL